MREEVTHVRLFTDASSRIEDPFLRRAYALAENGRGTTSPNPVVGCVIVKDGRVVGEGWHERAGGPHAEVNALQAAGENARGATAYVTLEPCNHVGRTPQCSLALVNAGIATVVCGMRDPNDDVVGEGAEALRAAGVHVSFAPDPAPFEEQNEAWIKYVMTGRPWVQAKVALSLDGHAALKEGERATLSGPECLALTMRLRRCADAILVGTGTLAADDPALTVRDSHGRAEPRQPLRVVLCRSELPSPDAKVFAKGTGESLALVAHTAEGPSLEALEDAGVRVERYDAGGGLDHAMTVLGGIGVTRVLAEPGPRLLESFWRAHYLDELVLYHTGGMAGASAPPLFTGTSHGVGGEVMQRMQAVEAGIAGRDAVSVWRSCPGWVCDVERT